MNDERTPERVQVIADDLLTVSAADAAEAQRIAEFLRSERWCEVVPGANSVVIQFDNAVTSPAAARAAVAADVKNVPEIDPEPVPRSTLTIHYGGDDGPDLPAVCRQLGLTQSEFIALHSSVEYRVEMLGFTPGFAYMAGLDPRLNVPRLAAPRQQVAAGSVGIAGGRTGIYALAGPGGWPLIGRVEDQLFDASAAQPFALAPAMCVRFAVSEAPP